MMKREQPVESSPFHRGERDIQHRMGVREQLEDLGCRVIRDHLPNQHREFYTQLPFLLVGAVDETGHPWASALFGRPGFVHSPNPRTLVISRRPLPGDPLHEILTPGVQVGVLGMDPGQRRRNRMTGTISSNADNSLTVSVSQSFGNCPQYIQARKFELLPSIDTPDAEVTAHALDRLSSTEQRIIQRADSFFIATHYAEGGAAANHGADVSHRGGKPGFVRIDNDRTLTFPDFSGNFHFNTIGNIELNPRAGLLFLDFKSRDLLYLTGNAEVIWDSHEMRAFKGAERLVRFTVSRGVRLEQALPIQWHFIDYSPSLAATGSWGDVAAELESRRAGATYRGLRVTKIVDESETIKSFYLEPVDGGAIPCHEAGQFLPIQVDLPGTAEPVLRTYTISNASNGKHFRLSIKRESASGDDRPAGLISNHFHDSIRTGSRIRALAPRGGFTLNDSCRSIVMLSAGVGITPMVSMLEALTAHRVSCGNQRKVWFIHGARNSREHAFLERVRSLAAQCESITAHVRYSQPLEDEKPGVHYDSQGRIDIGLLKSLLPFDDYDFYICGPQDFLRSLYSGLTDVGIRDERIHYEFFDAGASLKSEPAPLAIPDVADTPVKVRFVRSDVNTIWDPSKGTLLDLAESEGIQLAYSCRSGVCQTCATTVLSGTVAYVTPPAYDPPDGTALICCAYPDSTASDAEVQSLVLDN